MRLSRRFLAIVGAADPPPHGFPSRCPCRRWRHHYIQKNSNQGKWKERRKACIEECRNWMPELYRITPEELEEINQLLEEMDKMEQRGGRGSRGR